MIALQDRRLPIAAALGVAAIAGVGLLYAFDPNSASSPFPGCLFHAITGLYCPGCGITRMLHALVHGDLARAASMNVLALAGLPVFGVFIAEQAGAPRWLDGPLRRVLFDGRLWIGAAIAFGVLRNLPWAPFAALAPG